MATDIDIISAARGWIGTPYQHQASARGAGCDCLGLLRGVWRQLRGPEPESAPPYARDWAEAGSDESLRDALARHLNTLPLADVAPGDVLLFRMAPRSPAKHCAILAERQGVATIIHARQGRRVSEEDFTSAWRTRLAYAFRL